MFTRRERPLDRVLLLFALLLTFCVAGSPPVPARAADSPDRVAPAAIAATEAPVEPAPAAAARRLSPLAREIRQSIEAERAALAALQARFDRAANESEALAIQREIETLKRNGEIQILRIQAKHARLRGREAAARRIDAAIEAILHPVTVNALVRRPAPAEDRSGSR